MSSGDELRPDDPRLRWDGLVALVHDGPWWQPWRLPPERLPTAHSADLVDRARMPAGTRIAFRTDATQVELCLQADHESSPVDVLVGGQLLQRQAVTPGVATMATPLPAGNNDIEIWLPQWGQTQIAPIRFFGHSAIEAMPNNDPQWITYGSSITHCREADGPSETWPALVARHNRWRLKCLGFAAQCHLDSVAARTIREAPADLISLCIGINIWGHASFGRRSFAAAACGFIESIRDGHPTTPIAVVTPIASPARELLANAVGMTLSDYRADLTTAVTTLQELGDANLHIIDGLTLFGVADCSLLIDGVHPSSDGYRLIATRLGPILKQLMDAKGRRQV